VADSDQQTVISKRRPSAAPVLARPTRPADIGESLAGHSLGHFQLEEFIGGGGMGAVFRAVDTTLGRTVALKVVSSENADEETLKRFRNEAQSAARLDHPNIARVYFVGEDEGWNYIVFEYIEGVNIRDLVEHKGPLAVEEAISYTLQVAEALEHANQRDVVHRDIKPSNILVMPDGRAKLVDMGLARLHHVGSPSNDLTATGVTLGTFDYISPEQARDPRSADVRSDLYSLGCTLYYMLTGMPPFPEGTVLQKLLSHSSDQPPDPREMRADLSDDLAAITLKLMAKQPSQRYQSAKILCTDLLVLANHLGLHGVTRASSSSLPGREDVPHALALHVPWVLPLLLLPMAVFALESFWGDGSGAASVGPRRPVLAAVPASSSGDAEPAESVEALPGTAIDDPASRRPAPAAPVPPVSPTPAPERRSPAAQSSIPSDASSAARNASPATATAAVPNGAYPDTALPRSPASKPAATTAPAVSPPPPARSASSTRLDAPPAVTPTPTTPAVSASRDASDPPAAGSGATTSEAGSAPTRVVVGDPPGVPVPGVIVVDSLRQALREAAASDTIEVIELAFAQRREWPFAVQLNRKLTIRAAPGFAPILILEPSVDEIASDKPMIKLTGGRLVLEGIHFLVESQYEPVEGCSLFQLDQVDAIRLNDCSLTFRSDYDATAAFFSVRGPRESMAMDDEPTDNVPPSTPPQISLVRCIARGRATLVRATEGLPMWLDWEQGLFSSTQRLVEIGGLKHNSDARTAYIHLRRVTASAGMGMYLVHVNHMQPVTPEVSIRCEHCVVVTDAPLIEHVGVDAVENVETRLARGGEQNFYAGTQIVWRIQPAGADAIEYRWQDREKLQAASDELQDTLFGETMSDLFVRWDDRHNDRSPSPYNHLPEDFVLDEVQRELAGFSHDLLPVPRMPDPLPGAATSDVAPDEQLPESQSGSDS